MQKKFAALYFTNFWSVLNDNFLKSLICFIAIDWVSTNNQSFVVSSAAGALVLPYIIFSPLAGNFSIYFDKKNIVRLFKWIEIPIVLLAIVGFAVQSVWAVVLSVLLMGIQSSLYSPAKYGLIRDIGGVEGVSVGIGGMDAVAFIGMLLGMVTGSYAADALSFTQYGSLLLIFAALGLVGSYFIRANEKKSSEAYSILPIRFYRQLHRKISIYNKELNPTIYVLSVFWWMAALLQIGLIIYGKTELELTPFQTGLVMALAAIGVSAGCLCAGLLSGKIFLAGYTAYFGWGVSLSAFVLFFVHMSTPWFVCWLFLLSFLSGLFKLPLDAEIQKKTGSDFLSIVLAYFNQISFLFIFLASLTFMALTFWWSSRSMFLVIGLVFLLTPFYLLFNHRAIICFTCRLLLHLRYNVHIKGMENLKSEQTYLILPNHQAVVDPMILFAEFYATHISPLVDEVYFKSAVLRKILGLFSAVCVPDLGKSRRGLHQAKHLQELSITALKNGKNILFYPSGHITLDGMETIGNRQLAYNVCNELPENVTVLGIRTEGLWGSMWSRFGKKRTPNLAVTLLKSIGWMLCGKWLFCRRRNVKITIEPITEKVKDWSKDCKLSFNKQMELYYNGENQL